MSDFLNGMAGGFIGIFLSYFWILLIVAVLLGGAWVMKAKMGGVTPEEDKERLKRQLQGRQ